MLARNIWTACVCIILILFISLFDRIKYQTDLFALFPEVSSERLPAEIDDFSKRLSYKVTILIGGKDAKAVAQGFDSILEHAKQSQLFSKIQPIQSASSQQQVIEDFKQHRFSLLSQKDIQLLEKDDDFIVNKLSHRLASGLSVPFTSLGGLPVNQDPFRFFGNFLQQQQADIKFRIKQGQAFIVHKGHYYQGLQGELKQSPFSKGFQQQYFQFLDEVKQQQDAESEFLASGVIHYATINRENSEREIFIISLGSFIGIILLFSLTFRRSWNHIVILLPILIGTVTGVLVCALVFGGIHVITLIFGASIVGVSVDYSVHYFCSHSSWEKDRTAQQSMRSIMSPMTIAMASSVIGYLIFIASGFPAFQQVAIFFSSALLAAYLTVVLWFPSLLKQQSQIKPGLAERFLQPHQRLSQITAVSKPVLVVILSLIVAVFIIMRAPSDSLSLLRGELSEQSRIDSKIRTVLNVAPNRQFFVLTAESENGLLLAEEKLREQLEQLRKDKQLDFYQATSSHVPSLARQQQNNQLILQKLIHGKIIDRVAAQLKLSKELMRDYKNDIKRSAKGTLSIKEFQQTETGNQYKDFWLGEIKGQYYSIIRLFGATEIHKLIEIADASKDVVLVDKIEQLSQAMAINRVQIEKFIAVLLFVAMIIFALRFGMENALRIISIPLISGLLSLTLIQLFGGSYNIFHLFGFLIILSVTIDYALFAFKSQNQVSTSLAITLAAITTILSFGLLALSQLVAVHSFGVIILLGIVFAYVLTPLIIKPDVVS